MLNAQGLEDVEPEGVFSKLSPWEHMVNLCALGDVAVY